MIRNKKIIFSICTILLSCSVLWTMAACTIVPQSADEEGTYSQGLTFQTDGIDYYVENLGSCTDAVLIIPPTYRRSNVIGIGICAFAGQSHITSVSIPNGVTYIEERAFILCKQLTDIQLPDSVKTIGGGCFHGCQSLTSVKLPQGLTSISFTTFADCTGLHSVVIPRSVQSIESLAFTNCTSLTDIYFTGSETEWQSIQKVDGWDSNTGSYTVHFNYIP
jgi:hypothetical protein